MESEQQLREVNPKIFRQATTKSPEFYLYLSRKGRATERRERLAGTQMTDRNDGKDITNTA